jgi:hypothetical protein
MKENAMPKVRTTINPLTEIEVSPQEYAGLLADGLILKTQATTDDGLLKAAHTQVASFVQPGAYDDAPDDASPAEATVPPNSGASSRSTSSDTDTKG